MQTKFINEGGERRKKKNPASNAITDVQNEVLVASSLIHSSNNCPGKITLDVLIENLIVGLSYECVKEGESIVESRSED